ncbi:MAG: nitroreductase family protein [Spirochaetes bacterium]|nr:nitroreductase family protein [Spirochaetota bacterium]
MDAIKCLKTRRSIRKYRSSPIPKNIIEDIIDCARQAPTANNIQPWEFVVITDFDIKNKVAKLTDRGKFIAEAPLCIVVFSKETKYYLEDCSAATQNILLASWVYGLGSCWVAGDKKPYAEDIRKTLNVPEGFKLVSLVSIGYPEGKIPAQTKKSLTDVLHLESY